MENGPTYAILGIPLAETGSGGYVEKLDGVAIGTFRVENVSRGRPHAAIRVLELCPGPEKRAHNLDIASEECRV